MYIHSSDERSIQTVRGNKIDGLKINQYSEDKERKVTELGGESFTWKVLKLN